MERAQLALLLAEIAAQADVIENVYAKLVSRSGKKGEAATESLAYQLHNLYCAFEDLFALVAQNFENHIQDKARYHAELLRRMSLCIDGVRPALLSKESASLLEKLRSFRHFFRHAYSYSLDAKKVRIVLADALKLREAYPRDVADFVKKLEQ
ncbi:MAG: hypothetical protein DDT36_01349 [Firmicutes bacterium]|nr:hypothetical protein [Bacillota bacterium]